MRVTLQAARWHPGDEPSVVIVTFVPRVEACRGEGMNA